MNPQELKPPEGGEAPPTIVPFHLIALGRVEEVHFELSPNVVTL